MTNIHLHALFRFILRSVSTASKSGLSHDESLEIATTHLGKCPMILSDPLGTVESFPIDAVSHIIGQLLNGGKVNILVDTGTSKCYMSISFHLCHSHINWPNLLPKLLVCLWKVVNTVSFACNPCYVIIHCLHFQIFTLVSKNMVIKILCLALGIWWR